MTAACDASLAETSFVIDEAGVVTPSGLLEGASVAVEDGRIAEISDRPSATGRRIEARGAILLPGFIDMHCDANEKAVKPRPRAVFPLEMALLELDKQLVSCGITTMFHCVAFSNTTEGLRRLSSAEHLARTFARLAPYCKARTRVHARYDITALEGLPVLRSLLNEGLIQILSYMDHTPGQGQFATIEAYKHYLGEHHQQSEAQMDAIVAKRRTDREAVDEGALKALAQEAVSTGVPVASHDDDSAEKIAWIHGMGVSISEFPVRLEAARAACERGMHVAMGAPNLVRGASTNDNLGAREAFEAGVADMLCSDYSPMSMLHAIFLAEKEGLLPLHEAAATVSANVAASVGLESELGSIEVGKLADLVLVDPRSPVPSIRKTYVGGREVYATT
jgi:alpha-D-ribose 1-methylphosphonate 5-triphosphate diphosphatase